MMVCEPCSYVAPPPSYESHDHDELLVTISRRVACVRDFARSKCQLHRVRERLGIKTVIPTEPGERP